MKYLGIDYGKKRIGLAVSDDGGVLAFPKEIIDNSTKSLSYIVDTCKNENIGMVVIGESRDFEQNNNPIMDDINMFAEGLKKEGIKIEFHPELLTSVEASKIQGRSDNLDASAATIILQSYLDLKNIKTTPVV